MIGIDTNILVRLFAEDDLVQREAAVALLDGLGPSEKAMVNIVVVVELAWTLRRVYKFERDHIAMVLRELTEHPKIVLADRDIIRDAAHRYREEGGDVTDHIVALINRTRGCTTTYTFDEEAAGSTDFALLAS